MFGDHTLHLKQTFYDLRVYHYILGYKDTLSGKISLLLLLGLHRSSAESLFKRREQPRTEQRLSYKAVNSRFSRVRLYILPAVGCQHYHRGLSLIQLAYLFCDLYSVLPRHTHIHKYKIIGLSSRVSQLHHIKSLAAGQSGIGVHTDLFKNKLRVLESRCVVVYYQDAHILRSYVAVSVFCLSVARSESNVYREYRSLALLGLYGYIAAHHLDDILCYRHSETRTAVGICGGGILLRKRVEYFRQILLVHAYARIADREFESRVFLKAPRLLHIESDASGRGREFHGVSEYVYKHLFELHVVADIIIRDTAVYAALIGKSLVLTLARNKGVDLFKKAAELKLLAFYHHPAALYPAHIQYIVYEPEKMTGAHAYLFELFLCLRQKIRVAQSDIVYAYDSVHWRSYLVAHARQKRRFSHVRALRFFKRQP